MFGQNRTVRNKTGMSQEKFAQILGMIQQAYSRLESGKRQPTRQQVASMRLLDLIRRHNLIDEAISITEPDL